MDPRTQRDPVNRRQRNRDIELFHGFALRFVDHAKFILMLERIALQKWQALDRQLLVADLIELQIADAPDAQPALLALSAQQPPPLDPHAHSARPTGKYAPV